MKLILLLACVAVAVAAVHARTPIDAHLFDGLAQELGKVLKGLYDSHHTITQAQCVTDCDTNMGLRDNLCKDVCRVAATKYHNVLSS